MSKFTEAIEAQSEEGFVTVVGIAREVCTECDDWYTGDNDEGSFSWTQCESCGSYLGGNRYVAHSIAHEPKEGWPDGSTGPDVYHINICTDCLMYHANGDEPDPEEWR